MSTSPGDQRMAGSCRRSTPAASMRSALKYTAMPASVSCGTAHSTPLRVNWSTHRRLPVRRSVRPQHFCDVHQPAAVGVSGEVRVGQPEDVVGAAARDIGAQRVEVGGVRHHVDPYIDVGVDAGELVERLPVRGGHLLIPQAHGDHRPACGFRRSAQQHRGDEQHGHGESQGRRDQSWKPSGAQRHFSPVTTMERTMCLPSAMNSRISGTIATVVAAITSVHCAL